MPHIGSTLFAKEPMLRFLAYRGLMNGLSHNISITCSLFIVAGAEIERDRNNCYGLYCSGGSLTYWDDICFINTPPPCYGWTENIPGQCCPLCHVTPTTTPPPTTTPTTTTTTGPLPYCFFNGKLYKNCKSFCSVFFFLL